MARPIIRRQVEKLFSNKTCVSHVRTSWSCGASRKCWGPCEVTSQPQHRALHQSRHVRSIQPSTPPIANAHRKSKHWPLVAFGVGLFSFVLANSYANRARFDAPGVDTSSDVEIEVGEGELPLYRLSDIKKHGPKAERPWVMYKGKVYDITDWIPAHPGGEVILRAAGGSIEPYWDIFAAHKQQYVLDILEQFAIGKVHPDDLTTGKNSLIEDPFVSDPERDTSMRFLTQKPCNAETPAADLADSFLTPNDKFYVRNHMWVPVVDDVDNYDLTIELPNGDSKRYTLQELQTRFKQYSVTAVLQCSGNRRKDMTDHAKKTNGLQWTVGAISCAKWEGVRLRDVLADAGLPLDAQQDDDAQHVQFTGLEAYGASIPMTSAIDPRGDVLLAFRMNDEPLPRDHGFPIRVIVPGHVAARCVKWLKKIVVSDEESNTPWQRKDYKCFGPNEVTQDWDKYKSIQKMPITSAITRTRLRSAQGGQTHPTAVESDSIAVAVGETPAEHNIIEIEGYAYSGGGREVQRVDISLDGGKTWDQANLLAEDAKLERGSQPWCWKRWKYESPLPSYMKPGSDGKHRETKTTIVVKATDDTYNTQPETHQSIYNLRGNLATAWHRVEMSLSQGKEDEVVLRGDGAKAK
ncbi:Oxidoreductase, molybdopterin-binding domain-containing protein [Paramyrothecium foliicola]|nr:Oxidoreductase, molybdopterin-binding domain-containing protein [Paramyrothecium foliicola]